MAAIRRESPAPWRVGFCQVPLEKTANIERKLPGEYVVASQNDIAQLFRQYAEPLIGGPLRRYAKLG